MARTRLKTLGADALIDAAVKVAPSADTFAYPTSTSPQRFEVPAAWRGRWVTMHVEGFDLELVLGGSSVSCTYGQNSTLSTEAIVFNAATGDHYEADQKYDIFFRAEHTHFAIDAAGVGRVTMYCSQRPDS
jgi:hypothetical protein